MATARTTTNGSSGTSTALAKRPIPAGIAITSTDELMALATIMYKAGPIGFSKPEQVAVAIAFGLEIGLRPATAVNLIKVVNGKPSVDGEGALALLQTSPLLEAVDHGVEGDGDNRVGWITTKRRGEQAVRKTTFSVAEAKQAELWGKKGPWQTYQSRMLRWRAIGFHCKDWWADVMCGIAVVDDTVIEAEVLAVRTNVPAQVAPPPTVVNVPSANGQATATPQIADKPKAAETQSAPTPVPTTAAPSPAPATTPATQEQFEQFLQTRDSYLTSQGVNMKDPAEVARAWKAFVGRWNVDTVTKMTKAQAVEALSIIFDAIHTPEQKSFFSGTPTPPVNPVGPGSPMR